MFVNGWQGINTQYLLYHFILLSKNIAQPGQRNIYKGRVYEINPQEIPANKHIKIV